MANQRYVVWTNKGGTGKTTLTFHLSTEYAIQNPDKNIIVIDMCPQRNLSTVLLSGVDRDMNGPDGYTVWRNIMTQSVEGFKKTVCGYLLSKLERESTNDINCDLFLVKPSDYNSYITKNVYLLCGDPYLGRLAKRLEQERQMITTGGNDDPWKRVTRFIKEFIDKLSKIMKNESIFFIDTNSSFSVYTEMAIVGATRIIVPINADEFCRAAVASMLYLLHRIVLDVGDEQDDPLEEGEFNRLAPTYNIAIPKIHLVISNKVTPYDVEPAGAYSAKAREVSELLRNIREDYQDIFESDTGNGNQCVLNDLHTKAVQCLQLGCPLSKLPNSVQMNGGVWVQNTGRNGDDYLQNLQLIIDCL